MAGGVDTDIFLIGIEKSVHRLVLRNSSCFPMLQVVHRGGRDLPFQQR